MKPAENPGLHILRIWLYSLLHKINLKNMKITGDMIRKGDSGNLAISPYSPKIFEIEVT